MLASADCLREQQPRLSGQGREGAREPLLPLVTAGGDDRGSEPRIGEGTRRRGADGGAAGRRQGLEPILARALATANLTADGLVKTTQP